MAEEFRIISKVPPIHPKDVHPTKTAGKVFEGSDYPPDGGNDGKESDRVRCKQCGFPCKRDRDSKGSGWGNITTADVSASNNTDDPTVNAGCPLCGSSEYE